MSASENFFPDLERDFAEVVAENGEAEGGGQEARFAYADPEHESPIVERGDIEDALPNEGEQAGAKVLKADRFLDGRSFELGKKGAHARVISFWRIESVDQAVVATDEDRQVHLRNNIGETGGVIAGGFSYQPVFCTESGVELGSNRCLQDSDHGGNDAALLDKVQLAVEDALIIAVKTNDEASLNLHAGPLDFPDISHEIPSRVLFFVAIGKSLFRRGFQADENGIKPGFGHLRHEFRVIGQVDRGFGVEREPFVVRLLPAQEGREEFLFEVTLVADEIVINEKNGASPAPLPEGLEFGKDLRRRFGAGAMPEEDGDVAKVAVEGAPSGKLDAEGGVFPDIQ